MEIYDNDKTRKAYYVFPWEGHTAKKSLDYVAKTKHINPKKLMFMVGYVKGDELFFEQKPGSERVFVVYKRTKTDGEGNK